MQCCKGAKLQHLIVAEYYTYLFTADFIPILSYFIAVLIVCYISTVEYMLHMQCCNVTRIIECLNAALNKCLFSAALHAVCFKYNCIIHRGVSFWNSSLVESRGVTLQKCPPPLKPQK